MDKNKSKIPPAVVAIGIAQFLINISSVMIFSLSAVYLKSILGVGTGLIGFLEGAVEAGAHATKLFSGVMSDYFRRRKAIMVVGFALVTLSRPILAISENFVAVFTARFLDRFGNGIQATPRDALVGDIAPKDIKGACFGLRQSLGTAGSFAGGLIGILAMMWTFNNFHQVFWIATIPAFLAFVILVIAVKEPKPVPLPEGEVENNAARPKRHPIRMSDVKRLGKYYWYLIAIEGVFMLSRPTEAFLTLHAHQTFQLEDTYIPAILLVYNLTYCLSSYPIGRLADRMNRYVLLMFGFAALIVADIVLAFAPNVWWLFGGVAIWGIQMGISQSVFLTLIDQSVPGDLRGTAFGIFYLTSAVAIILAGTGAGHIAQHFGDFGMTFLVSGIVGSFALFLLWVLPRPKK